MDSFAPGEWDWLTAMRGPFGGTPPFNPTGQTPTFIPPASVPNPQTSPLGAVPGQDGIFGKINKALQPLGGALPLGLNLLANSGPSAQPKSFGQVLGQSALQSQGMQQGSEDSALKRQYMQAQIDALKRKPASTPFAEVSPSQYTPESIAAFQKSVAAGTPDYSLLAMNPKSADSPSNIREYEYYSKLSPAEQKKYLEMKRSLNPFALGEMAGGKVAFDKRSGTYVPLTSASQEASGEAQVAGAKATATASGEQQGKAQFDFPRVEQNVQQAVSDIDKLRNHTGLPMITGMMSKLPVMPGTTQASADALAKQVQGQTFLQAYNTLRGGGQITEIEGAKAEAAIARLQRSQSTKDYQASLDELKDILTKGLERARQQAGVKSAPTKSTPAKNQSLDDLLKKYGQ